MMLKTFAVIGLCLFCNAMAKAQTQLKDSAGVNKMGLNPQPNFIINHLPSVVPPNLNTKNLPFFCDKEYKLEKLTKIPFRFRLGSVAYCDKMEGKNN